MEGRKVGDRFDAVVPPSEGYGERNGAGPQAVPRTELPADMDVQPGMQLAAQLPDGRVIPLFVVDLDDEHVYLDDEHPLAGATLHFAIEVIRIRAATAEEMQHGHPHGAEGNEGHHH
jgi:FKBP-type peptidyl-prolyl cis-trans isomerase SlyD